MNMIRSMRLVSRFNISGIMARFVYFTSQEQIFGKINPKAEVVLPLSTVYNFLDEGTVRRNAAGTF